MSIALDATAGLRDSWNQLTAGTVAAIKLSTLLSTHDRQTATAARTGTRGDYMTALAQLDEADATIAQSEELRDQLANTVDVSVLTTWLDRNAAYDKALRNLYSALQKSKGKATAAVKAASKAEQQAREQLPPDSDHGRGREGRAQPGRDHDRGGPQAVVRRERRALRPALAYAVLTVTAVHFVQLFGFLALIH
ncbi:MAG: hypothetical protein E6I45_04470 [Chloroflexi bacterium]|nr:MAG: hypothetical protein E6I45_04470 [Chloroflexota bacterium]